MDLDPIFLSRIQFAFVVSFHIIFPAFTIGLAAWLATIEGVRLATGDSLYRRVFDFWLKVFALSPGGGATIDAPRRGHPSVPGCALRGSGRSRVYPPAP